MAQAKKETIYIDVEDDITAIVDKVRGSKEKIIALVLPKHAPSLQSTVNMKLIKRASDQLKKHIVLITNEAPLLPLAGASGIYVAKTLQSKPSIPKSGEVAPIVEKIASSVTEIPATAPLLDDAELDLKKPVGEYMKYSTSASVPVVNSNATASSTLQTSVQNSSVDDEVLEMIEAPDPTANIQKEIEEKPTKETVEKERKFKIPNFEKFRLKLFIGLFAVIALGLGGYVGFVILPKATITVTTETSSKLISEQIIASTEAKTAEGNIIPAQNKESKQSVQEIISSPSGTKDLGTKATGSITITNCTDNDVTIPVGTGVSSGDLTYLTNKTVVVPASDFFSAANGGACKDNGVASVNVTSIAVGDKYNADAKGYAIADVPTSVKGAGTSMTGGTTKIVKTVTEQDLEIAKQKLTAKLNSGTKKELQDQLTKDGYFPLVETYTETQSTLKSVPAVGEEATSATVSMDVSYSMYGVKQEAINTFETSKLSDSIDEGKQKIVNDGLDKAVIKITDAKDPKKLKLSLDATATIGPKLDTETIKKQVAGKKSGDIKDNLKSLPGVKEVIVETSPFWVSKPPTNVSKITVKIQ